MSFFSASIGGHANFRAVAANGGPGGLGQNATESLVELTDRSDLDGLDIDYEGGPAGLGDSFVDCMSQVLINTGSPRMEGSASIASFGVTAGPYQAPYQQCGTFISQINYQAHADNIPDVQGYLDLYARLAAQYPFGYPRLGLGIASSISAPEGLAATRHLSGLGQLARARNSRRGDLVPRGFSIMGPSIRYRKRHRNA